MANPYGRKGKFGAFIEALFFWPLVFIVSVYLFVETLKWYYLVLPTIMLLLLILYLKPNESYRDKYNYRKKRKIVFKSQLERLIKATNKNKTPNDYRKLINYVLNHYFYMLIKIEDNTDVVFSKQINKENKKYLSIYSSNLIVPSKHLKNTMIKRIQGSEFLNNSYYEKYDFLMLIEKKCSIIIKKEDYEITQNTVLSKSVSKFVPFFKCHHNIKVNLYTNTNEMYLNKRKESPKQIDWNEFYSIIKKSFEQKRTYLNLEYEFADMNLLEKYDKLCDNIDLINLIEKIGTGSYCGSLYYKTNGGAVKSVKLNDIEVTAKHAIKSNITINSISFQSFDILFFPNFIIETKTNSIYSYKGLKILLSKEIIIEEQLPADTEVIDYTWKYVNKNGTRDKRYKNNERRYKCKYGKMEIFFNDKYFASIVGSSFIKILDIYNGINAYKKDYH